MAKKNGSGFEVEYKDFKYKGYHEDYFFYEIPFEKFCDGIRKYFDDRLVTLDGTNTAIWNTLVEFGEDALDTIFDELEDWFKEECKEDAYEEFKDYVDYFVDDED